MVTMAVRLFPWVLLFITPSRACPKTSDTPTAKGRGRCGPHFNNQVCSGSGYAIFCNEFNGWCGNTAAHRDAQPSTTYDASSIPAKCKRGIISLDHHKLTFASNSGTISDNTLILRNNQHADVSAKQLGDFGASDFTIELTYTGIGSDATPDGGYGTLFVRSSQHNQPYTGPSAFLYDNGKIIFRLRYDDALDCPGAFPGNAAANPTRLAFTRKGQQLAVTVGGSVVCSRTMTKRPDVGQFSSAPLRFGANHVNVNSQNLDVKLSNIVLLRTAKTIKAGLVNLNGHPTAFEFNSGRVTSGGNKLILTNDQQADISSAALGDFGASNFIIQFTYTGVGSDATPDGTFGALFIRSSQFESPYTGPTAFLFDTGKIIFRLRYDDALECPHAISDTTAKTPTRLVFERVDNKLSVSVNGVTVCSRVMKLRPDVSEFITAPLRFGGNHQHASGQNLNVELSKIVLLSKKASVGAIRKSSLKCSGKSPAGCAVWDIKLKSQYSAGALVKVVGGNDVFKSTDVNSCPLGWKLWAPQSRADWEGVVKFITLPAKPHLIVDVTRKSNGCGGCKNHAMNSGVPEQSSWVTSDGQPWWLRAKPYNEPNGDYQANCYLGVYDSTPDAIRFNDKKCSYHSTSYLCQPIRNTKTITILDSWTHKVQSNKWASLGEVTHFVETDISAFASGDRLKSSVVLMLNVDLTSASHYPTRFEYCNKNNADGFVVSLPVPAGGWQVGPNQVSVSESAFAYTGTRDWSHRTRLELYVNTPNAGQQTDTVTFSRVRFVDTNADWCDFVAGDGTGASGTEQKLPVEATSRQQCAMLVHQLHPTANGATYGVGSNHKCYAEFGMTKSNGNPKWQTCKLPESTMIASHVPAECARCADLSFDHDGSMPHQASAFNDPAKLLLLAKCQHACGICLQCRKNPTAQRLRGGGCSGVCKSDKSAYCAICATNPKACPARCVGSTDKHHTVCLESGDLDDDCCGLKGTISCLPGYTFARGKRCMPDVDGLGLRYKTQCTKLTCAECKGRQRLGENIACTMCNVMPVPGRCAMYCGEHTSYCTTPHGSGSVGCVCEKGYSGARCDVSVVVVHGR